jgi:hypothetical protein
MFWVPARESVLRGVPDAGRVVLAVAPIVMLLTSSRLAGIRGLVARSGLFIVLPLVPVGSILGMTLTLLNVRLAYMSSIGFMILWSAGILGCLPWRWLAGSLFTVSLLTFLWLGNANLESHFRAGETSERVIDIAARASAELSESESVGVGPLPEESDGVYALEAGYCFAVARRSGQRNLVQRPRAGRYEDFFEFDDSRRTLRRPSEVKPAFALVYGEPHKFACAPAKLPDVVNGSVFPGDGNDWCVFSTSDATIVYLPAFELPGPGNLKFTLEGGLVEPPAPRPLEVLTTFVFDKRRVLRSVSDDASFLVPAEARVARIELLVPLGHALKYSGFQVEIERTPSSR